MFVDAGACVSSCPAGKVVIKKEIFKDGDNNAMYIRKKNYCVLTTDLGADYVNNCGAFAASVRSVDQTFAGDVIYGCIYCLSDLYSPVIDIISEVNPLAG